MTKTARIAGLQRTVIGLSVLLLAGAALVAPRAGHAAGALAVFTVAAAHQGASFVTDGTVEAVRDAKVASQVPGRVLQVLVKAGDAVQAGQVLARIDGAVVQQQVSASQAQVAQAQAQAALAQAELARTRQLVQQKFLSQSALDRAQAQARAAEAQVKALQAQTGSVSAQASLYVVKAPFAGWVSQLTVSQGDVANPGQPLMTVYDPTALRATAQVPEQLAARIEAGPVVSLEVSGRQLTPQSLPDLASAAVQVLPAIDPVSRTATVRMPLPASISGLQPGQSVKLVLRTRSADMAGQVSRYWIPAQSLVRRGELTAVYVVDKSGYPRLRQIRLGRSGAGQVEVLAGLAGGERVALDVVAAARSSQP